MAAVLFSYYKLHRQQFALKQSIANRTKYDVGDLFTVNTVKYFADGTLSMIEPYDETSLTHKPGTREPLLWDEEHMMASMALANKDVFDPTTGYNKLFEVK